MDEIKDITIIGAGPSGLFTAFQGGMYEASVRIIDSMPEPGGQLTALYPEKYIFDAPGFTRITAKELASNLFSQADQFSPDLRLNETVVEITEEIPKQVRDDRQNDRENDRGEDRSPPLEKGGKGGFEVVTDKGHYLSKTVIIAAGLGAFKPRSLEIPGTAKFDGKGVYYAVREKDFFKGKKVVIVGGGDSAFDWAINLLDVAGSIAIVHRTDKFRAHPNTIRQVSEHASQGRIQIFTPYEIKEAAGNEILEKVILSDNNGKEVILQADALLLMLGFTSDLGPIGKWGLEIDDNRIKVSQNLETNRSGIFAVGDIANYPGKLKLILTGFSDGAQAVRSAVPYIRPGDKLRHVHSTSSRLFSR